MSRLKYFSTETNQWEYADNVTGNNTDLTNYATKEYVENSKVAIDTTLTIEGQAADAKAVCEAISKLSGEKADKTGLRLGVHTDGLVYLFVDNAPVGTGIDISAGGVSGYVDSENNIILNNLPDGTYTIKYEMEDGNYIDIGNLELDNNVYYSVTNNLTNCTSNNSAIQAVEGESYSATITATSGYELKSVTVTMGGSPVTVSGGVINIANVTGSIVITAVAEEIKAKYTNLAEPKSADWLENHRINGSGDIVGGDGAYGIYVTNYIPCKLDDDVRIKGLTLTGKNMRLYDSSKAGITNTSYSTLTSEGLASLSGDVVTLKAGYETANYKKSATAYMRFCGTLTDGYTANDVIITVNEEIIDNPEVTPSYTNLVEPTSSDFWNDSRIGSDGTQRTGATGNVVTNMIKVYEGDIIRISGLNLTLTTNDSNGSSFMGVYNSAKSIVSVNRLSAHVVYFNDITETATGGQATVIFDDAGNGAYLRFAGKPTNGVNNIIITINEPIE